MMPWIIIGFVLLVLFLVLNVKNPSPRQMVKGGRVLPNDKPVYIDPQTVYFNEPILYSEWPQAPCEISSSL